MSRADAWSDAGEIMEQYSGIAKLWPYYQETALRTSLTQDQAEVEVLNRVQAALGDLLYEFGDYGKGEDDGNA